MFGHLRDIVEGLSVWVTQDIEIPRSWHWSDCTNDFAIGVFESHVTTELLSFLLILKFFYHFISAFFRNFKLIFELTPNITCTTWGFGVLGFWGFGVSGFYGFEFALGVCAF